MSAENTVIDEKILGIDVSEAQGGWASGPLSPEVKFAIIKATEGKSYVNKCFHKQVEPAISQIELVGAYHVFRPEDSPESQIENFFEVLEEELGWAKLKEKLLLPPSLDVEVWRKGEPVDISDSVLSCAQIIEKETGLSPFIYCNDSFTLEHLKLGQKLGNYKLWIASWGRKEPLVPGIWWKKDNSGVEKPTYSIWQWGTQRVGGFANPVDANYMDPVLYRQLIQAKTSRASTEQASTSPDATNQDSTEQAQPVRAKT